MRHARWLSAIVVLFTLAPAPARAVIEWVQNGISAFGAGVHVYPEAPVLVTHGSSVYVATAGHVTADPVQGRRVLVQKYDRCGVKLWGSQGLSVYTGGTTALDVEMVSDGGDGIVVSWVRDGDVYAQRVDGNGNAMWLAGGVPVAATAAVEATPQLVADPAGGVYVFWKVLEGTYVTRAQRLDANGTPLLAAGGIRVASHAEDEYLLDATGGAGTGWATGAILAYKLPSSNAVYLQRINGAGIRLWGTNGVSPTPPMPHLVSDMDPDGAGGVWFAYEMEAPVLLDIQAVHVGSGGVIDESYQVGAVSAVDDGPHIAAVGNGKAHLAWTQTFSGGTLEAVVKELGALNTYVVGLDSFSDQRVSDIAADGVGGSFVVWEDERNGSFDVYAIRFFSPSFPWGNSLGLPYCVTTGSQVKGRVARTSTGWAPGDFYLAWTDERLGVSQRANYVQRLDGVTGIWGHPEIKIVAAEDCDGDDEGGCMRLEWHKSQLDGHPFIHPADPVTMYSIWRAVDALPMYPPDPICPAGAPGGRVASQSCAWEWVMDVPISDPAPDIYSMAVPTTRDVAPGDSAVHYFSILAHDGVGGYYVSLPEAGASEDDIAPDPPTGIDGGWIGSWVYVQWSPPTAPDVAHYKVQRAQRSAGQYGPWIDIGTSPDTLYTDTTADAALDYRYRAAAVDDNGNEGSAVGHVTINANPTAADRPGVTPDALRVLDASPNPFGDATTLRVGIPSPSVVTVEVYDARGRRVHRETQPSLEAGWHALRFHGRDDSARLLPSGVYFYRVTSGGESATRKIVILR